MRQLVLLLCIAAAAAYSPLQYMGDQLLTLTPSTQEQVDILEQWRELGLQGKETDFLDFWSGPSAPGRSVQVRVTRKQLQDVKAALAQQRIQYRVSNPDLGRLFIQENDMNRAAFDDHSKYHRYAEFHAIANALISKCGSQCSKEVIGKSIENRDIIAYKLGSNSANPMIFMDGGIHAREWISPATLLYIMDQVISDPQYRSLLDSWNLVFVPLANPDGYEYTHTSNRMWRKNRRPGRACYGVDLNRNFEFKFGGTGSSGSQCSDVYRGVSAFSEPETQAIRNFVLRNKSAIKAFWSVHSYGQYWLHPFGYAFGVNPNNVAELLSAAQTGARALQSVNGRRYTVGHSADLLYPAAGGSDDWAISIGIRYAYTLELPDTGRYGFVLPPAQIVSVGRETLAGLAAFLRAV
ncbi:hypothetical protein BOX15_Mlig026911g1 [Macrostomum lignano]|uniref:Uncharacterized protein n=2 Tax=Macrostomum lignano TaxID=282301 RepID=A0A267HAU7_9PLAT|nr:hypothetical protein BOX15_Mlig026911g1 [Macrostomum lignano]